LLVAKFPQLPLRLCNVQVQQMNQGFDLFVLRRDDGLQSVAAKAIYFALRFLNFLPECGADLSVTICLLLQFCDALGRDKQVPRQFLSLGLKRHDNGFELLYFAKKITQTFLGALGALVAEWR
jgi:hypothetical protein